MKPLQAPGPQEPAARDAERRLIELRRLSVEDPAGRWFLPLASLLLEQQAISEAQQLVRHSLARDPDAIGGWVLLGRSYLMSGEVAAARRIMASVLARDPENAHALRVHAHAEAELGERDAAIRGYRALLRLVPGDVGAQEALAELLDHEGGNGGDGGGTPLRAAAMAAARGLAPNGAESVPVGAAPSVLTAPDGGRTERSSRGRGRRGRTQSDSRPARAERKPKVLPPARRPGAGIFESLPADLDWGRPAGPRAPSSNRQAPKEAPRRKGVHQGFRRWLDRLSGEASDGEVNDPEAPQRDPRADA